MAYYNNNQGGYGSSYGQPGNPYGSNPYSQNSNPCDRAPVNQGRPQNPYDRPEAQQQMRQQNPYDRPVNQQPPSTQSPYDRPPPSQSPLPQNPYNRAANQQPRATNPYDRAPANAYSAGGNGYGSNAPPSYVHASNVEMQPLSGAAAPAAYDAAAPQQDPNHLLNECRTVSRAVDDLEARLGDLQRLQRAFTSGQGQSNKEIDALSAEIMTGYRGLTERVRRIKGNREAGSPRNRAQVESLDRKVRAAINSYQRLESAFRKEVQESQRRQYLIVNPSATEQEIEQATSGNDVQIFQQALLNSDRRGQAQSTLSNVKQRHAAIQEVERTMMELSQLFQDLDRLVIEQDPVIQNIETKAEDTYQTLEQSNVHVSKAIVSARAARKKKWICLGISIAIILVIVLIVVVYLAATGRFSGNNSSNNSNSGH